MRAAVRGTVYLVGAGPGIRIGSRDVPPVSSNNLPPSCTMTWFQVLQLAGPTSSIRNVRKRCGRKAITQEGINWLMIALAWQGESVVQLKSGDPLLHKGVFPNHSS